MNDAIDTIWRAFLPAVIAASLLACLRVGLALLRPGNQNAVAPTINLDNLESEDSLADRIAESLLPSDFHAPTREYLPEPQISRLITAQSIIYQLNKFEDELATKLRGPSSDSYGGFMQYDCKYRTELAQWISLKAPKLFAIVVQCELDHIKFVLAMRLFRQHQFCDTKLPVANPSKHIDLFLTKIWSRHKLRNFYERQWRVLVPVFSPLQYNHDLDSDCIFPFDLIKSMPKAGAFSSVYRVRIHSEHQLHEGLGDVRPSHSIISQTITQLEGIADALTNLHNYRDGRRRSLSGNEGSFMVPTINVDQADIPVVPNVGADPYNEDELNTPNSVSIRHGDLKPENILRFTVEEDSSLGTLKIADMGLAKQHVLKTSDRNAKRLITNTRYGTQPYEAPETITAKYGLSRLYDIWSMGCITLEFIIWIIYGNEQLTSFYNQIAGGPQLPYQYYEIPDANEPTHAEVHRVVLKWIDHIETQDPEFSQDSALKDLLALVRDKLLVVRLPASSVSSRSGGRTLAPPALGGASQFRATAEEFRDALRDILARTKHDTYLFSDYSLPPLKDWQFPVDNRFAEQVASRISNTAFNPQHKKTHNLCNRCRSLKFWTGGFSIDDYVSSLLVSAQNCDFCTLLRDARREDDSQATDQIRFERKESNLLLTGDPFPVLSIVRVLEARLTRHFQIGFPELPEPSTPAFFSILNTWLDDCNANHRDLKNKNRDCTGVTKMRLPTRLIDVGTIEAPRLRLVETQAAKLDKSNEYIALSHPWGDTRKYIPFRTLRSDPRSHHDVSSFKNVIPEGELPATFRDAVICSRKLGIKYLWIDSICIIQGEDGDFTDEAKYMEDVFSNAYCVLAASRAYDQRGGFLGQRKQRNYVTFESESGEPFFVCEPIDNFNKDVIQGALNKRGWVLQERALARRTIYFTETQTYFECGCGVRCETMAKMHNGMADFLGDPRFPEKAMRDDSRALKIEYFQGLYKQYSRLNFTRYEDRPFAIAGLERRLRDAFDTKGGFGIFDDGDRTQLDNGMFHRSLLWKRGEDDIQETLDGKDPVVEWLEPIDFTSERNIQVPSWSWMAYKGAIDYMDPPYGTADWETKEIIPPWTQGRRARDYPALLDRDIGLEVIVRDFNDRERTTASDGRRAQCVVVARSKEPKDERQKRIFVLLVTATQISGMGPKLYKRAGVGVMLGRFVTLQGDGLSARVL
ncbi:hypothetical protein DE146DRAFT_748230 [Phaeosphaeria sp. MPI-PUGE-AT-0046c]|nr:hypothetical protein DE146DRAFT_748230 [Phaeosphaeria sp. MPI-PUGE-AT-0046c]